ncbi:putative arginine kinase F46H5.3 [Pseudolycoriella hygida]|uniref:arginine kinase n=1 Tax=Pseudolycoriella hygida TaxID=35572 RepID=A0A9Q0MPR4_9DIPT|nr:putative arginine kinase F46H5.3 [Pseudolycoriella hygida]
MEARKEEFRKYLEETGVIGALTKALIKLYEMKFDRPDSAVLFIQKELSGNCVTLAEYQNVVKELEEAKVKIAAQTATVTKSSTRSVPSVRTEETAEVPNEPDATSSDDKDLLEKLQADETCNSLLKQYLTMELLESLQNKTTASGKSIRDCINSGLQYHTSSVGIYAADADAYEVFSELFNPIIAEYHEFSVDQSHPLGDGWEGDDSYFEHLDESNKYITSTRIRCARSMEDFPLNPSMSEQNYLDLMKEATDALGTLTDDLEGTFYPLEDMDPDEENKMIEAHQLFKSGDKCLQAAGALNFWPKGRGIFKNTTETFLVWVNEEDHLRFISMDQGGDIRVIYNRLKDAVTKCSDFLKFKRDDRLGWITFCPTNLGSTIRASVMITLPNLTAKGNLRSLADSLNLQIRGTHGEHSEVEDGMYEISNRRRLGVTEFDAVKEMYDGIKQLIEAEEQAEV